MKPNSAAALATTAQALAITSQLLAIGIEVGIIAGGFYIYKKITEDKPEAVPSAVLVPSDTTPVQIINQTQEPTFKQRWDKIGRIFKAVIG